MSFNLFVAAVAIGIGVLSALVAVRGRDRHSDWLALGRGLLVGLVLSFGSLVITRILVGSDVFAAMHVVYVIVTVGVPLAALITVARSSALSRGPRILLLVLLLPAPLGFYATHIEPFWLRVDHVEVAVPVQDFVGLRIGVLSDLQTESIGHHETSAVDTLVAQQPDVVLIPGDLWQMPEADFEERSAEFTSLIGRLCGGVQHVMIVNGNTDNLLGLRSITTGTCAVVLDNEIVEVTIAELVVRVLGVTYGGDQDNLEAARESFIEPGPRAAPIRIVLAHQPDEVFEFGSDDPIDLLVAGHTHGGQISLPLFGPPLTLSSVPRAVAAGGLHEIDGHAIYVSTGVGRERGLAPQLRFGVQPSIGIIDFVSDSR